MLQEAEEMVKESSFSIHCWQDKQSIVTLVLTCTKVEGKNEIVARFIQITGQNICNPAVQKY